MPRNVPFAGGPAGYVATGRAFPCVQPCLRASRRHQARSRTRGVTLAYLRWKLAARRARCRQAVRKFARPHAHQARRQLPRTQASNAVRSTRQLRAQNCCGISQGHASRRLFTAALVFNYAILEPALADYDPVWDPYEFDIGKHNPRTFIAVIK